MTHIDFMGNSKKYFIVSGVLIAVIIICLAVLQLRLDIQFKGGSMVTYAYDGDLDMNAFAAKADSLMSTPASLRENTDAISGVKTVVVTFPGTQSLSADAMAQFTSDLQQAFPGNNIRSLQINNVDPAIGGDFLAKSLVAVVFASILMILYVAWRFRRIGGFSAGVMAVVALIHDVIIIFGVFVIFRIPVNDNFIAVVLTILGYSVNDTIVIYDRIRENKRLMGSKTPVGELVNTSINQSFRRTLNTSITTALAMVVVAVVALVFRVDSIQSFAFPMIIGLISGNYSSICIAGPLWVRWQEHKLKPAATA